MRGVSKGGGFMTSEILEMFSVSLYRRANFIFKRFSFYVFLFLLKLENNSLLHQ